MDPTERFSDRAAEYTKYRPSYPAELLTFMRDKLGLTAVHVVADVGSGTGILAKLFLDNGNVVYGVEPNAAMRQAADASLAGYEHFHSVAGRAEATTLKPDQADYVVAGQAFHWFHADEARVEFRRILKRGGWVVLIWNSRRIAGTPFLEAYETFLKQWGTDYAEVQRRYDVTTSLLALFGGSAYERASFQNAQSLDLDGLRGLVLSSSYMPGAEHPRHGAMLDALRALFDELQEGGRVRIDYDTDVYFATLV